jgi:hypothetical protein
MIAMTLQDWLDAHTAPIDFWLKNANLTRFPFLHMNFCLIKNKKLLLQVSADFDALK